MPGRLGLAVSGGPDSLALLLLAQDALPGRIAAATVDHGLRPEAAEEAAFVSALCSLRGIPHTTLRPPQPIAGNVQSAARAARYKLLVQWAEEQALPFIATAHHADDQLETLLMRLARGSGVAGLSGIRRRNGSIVRPLLEFTKDRLVAICAEAGLTPVDDPSNRDPTFDRVRMRALLNRSSNAFSPGATQRTADALFDAQEALCWVTDRAASEAITAQGEGWLLRAAPYPREIQRRLLSLTLARLGESPRGDVLSRALDSLRAGQKSSVGAALCDPRDDGWLICPAPPHRLMRRAV